MRIAITGATGFVGQHLTRRLIEQGHQVQAWFRGDRPPAIDGPRWIAGELDAQSPENSDRLVEQCDAVVHAAVAQSGGSFMDPPDDPISYFQTNVLGTLQLIESAKRAGVRRFIALSSGAVHQHVADDLPIDERHPLWPASLYGAYKASVETLIHATGLSGQLTAASLRPVSIVGVEDPPESSKWFDLVRDVANGKTVDIGGGGKVVLVDDVVASVESLLAADDSIAGQTYNCCTGFVSNERIAALAKSISGSDSKFEGTPKAAGKPMRTDKIERLGMRFSGEDAIENIVRSLIRCVG